MSEAAEQVIIHCGSLEEASLIRDALVALAPALRVAGHERQSASPANALEQLQRTRQLAEAGEIAIRLQHALNNPLTALLAEGQLMELEAETEDQRAVAARMLTQVRRLIEIVKRLDGVSALSRVT